MRKLFYLLILFLTLSCTTHENALYKHTKSSYFMDITDNNSLQKIIVIDADKNKIFDKINEYFKFIFTDGESKIKIQNKEKGIIEGIGNLILVIDSYIVSESFGSSYKSFTQKQNVLFNYIIEIKENKFRITILDPFWYIVYENRGKEKYYPVGENFYINLAISIDKIMFLENIKTYIENGEIEVEAW